MSLARSGLTDCVLVACLVFIDAFNLHWTRGKGVCAWWAASTLVALVSHPRKVACLSVRPLICSRTYPRLHHHPVNDIRQTHSDIVFHRGGVCVADVHAPTTVLSQSINTR